MIFHVCWSLPSAACSWLTYSLPFREVYAAEKTRHLHVVYKFNGPRCTSLGIYTRAPMLPVANSDTHAMVCGTAAANPQIRPCRLLRVSTLPSKVNFGYCCSMRAACVTRRGKAVSVSYCVRSLTYACGGKRRGEKAVGWGQPTGPRRLYCTAVIRVRHRQPGLSLKGAFYTKFGILTPYVSLILL